MYPLSRTTECPFTGLRRAFNSANRSQASKPAEDSANNMRAQLAALHRRAIFTRSCVKGSQHNLTIRQAARFSVGLFLSQECRLEGKISQFRQTFSCELAQIPVTTSWIKARGWRRLRLLAPSPVDMGPLDAQRSGARFYVSEWARTGFQGA